MVLTGGMRLLSGLTLPVPTPPLAKPRSMEVKGCYAQDSLVRGYFPVQEGQLLKEYGAITTCESVFSNPTLKTLPHSLVACCQVINLPPVVAYRL